jgi:TRAP-type C4-dicarboxylate transport system permease small subunit
MRRLSSSVNEALLNVGRFIFAATVISIFIIVYLVQSQIIKTPKWARDWSGEPPEAKRVYAAALMTPVCIVFLLFAIAGYLQMRREDVR